mgnify:CR=1 FL=1
MANPNIVSVASIYGECCGWALTTGLTTTLFTVSASKLIKINRIVCTNVDGTSAADLNLLVTTAIQTSLGGTVAGGATNVYLAKTISVPADASLVVSDTPIYLMEGDVLQGSASVASDLDLFVSYDVIID